MRTILLITWNDRGGDRPLEIRDYDDDESALQDLKDLRAKCAHSSRKIVHAVLTHGRVV